MKQSICQQCNSFFIVTPGSFGKFCSLSCGTTYRNIVTLEKSIANYQLSPIQCKCCDAVLEYDKRKNKFCSHSCAAKITNNVPRKRGQNATVKLQYSRIKFILCTHTNQYYSNKNSDGSTRRCSPYIKSIKEKYYSAARFKFNVYHYPEEFDLLLIAHHGWYTCPGLKRKKQSKNILGVSRDHIVSVSYGFANGIDPKIIAHPANCRIMLHSENKTKHSNCDITLTQLLEKIGIWDQKHSERRNGLEPLTSNLEG